MKPRANQFGPLQVHRPARPVVIWPQRLVLVGRLFMRLPARSCSSVALRPAARLAAFARSLHGHLRLQIHHAAALIQPAFSFGISRPAHQSHAEEPVLPSTPWSNMALNLARFAHWTLRDKAAQRRLALRYAPTPSHSRNDSPQSSFRNSRYRFWLRVSFGSGGRFGLFKATKSIPFGVT